MLGNIIMMLLGAQLGVAVGVLAICLFINRKQRLARPGVAHLIKGVKEYGARHLQRNDPEHHAQRQWR